MANIDSESVLDEIELHASAILSLTQKHSTIYKEWLQSLGDDRRKEWAQLVGGAGRKGGRRRKQVDTLIRRRGQICSGKDVASEKVSSWDKREDLLVLCINITLEDLANLNHLVNLDQSPSFSVGMEHLIGPWDFAAAYRRSLRCEDRRVHDRIHERFECLVFYLNLVDGGFHSGSGWMHGGQKRLLEIQKPPDELVKAKQRNERMAERGLSYYCWGLFLGDLRNLTRLRADEDVPESL